MPALLGKCVLLGFNRYTELVEPVLYLGFIGKLEVVLQNHWGTLLSHRQIVGILYLSVDVNALSLSSPTTTQESIEGDHRGDVNP
jgi:hypothetical protein